MYREQAVEIIERHIDNNIASGSLVGQALSMAIEALKTQLSQSTTSDLISRQQTLNALMDAVKSVGVLDADDIKAVFDMLPSAQPEPHEGHWIEGGIYRDVIECNCSECGQLMTTAATVRMNYCPHCGAKMKGAKHEND